VGISENTTAWVFSCFFSENDAKEGAIFYSFENFFSDSFFIKGNYFSNIVKFEKCTFFNNKVKTSLIEILTSKVEMIDSVFTSNTNLAFQVISSYVTLKNLTVHDQKCSKVSSSTNGCLFSLIYL
jgi:hypothetical protein